MAKGKDRSEVPEVDVVSVHVDERAEMIKELQDADPDFVYSYESADRATARRLSRLKATLVTEEDGEALKWADDVVIKIPKDVHLKTKMRGEDASRRKVERHLLDPNNKADELKREERRKLLNRKSRRRKPPSVEEMESLQ